MSSPPPNPRDDAQQPRRADELTSRLLDDGEAADSAPELSVVGRRRVADMQWLDALLEHAQGRNTAAIEESVAMVLRRLSDETETPTLLPLPAADATGTSVRLPKRRWGPQLVAAAVLALIGLVWWQQAPNAAYAMVEQAYRAALSTADRTYRVTLAFDEPLAKTTISTLTVRGGEKFAFEHTGPLGGRIWIGGNGTDFWFIPPVGPVLVADSGNVIGQWLDRSQTDMPYLQLTTILERLRNHYDLTVLPNERLAPEGPLLQHLHAQRRNSANGKHGRLPETVDAWADRQTGVIQRLVLSRSRNATSRRPQKITFDLTDEEPRPADFYDYSPRAPNRGVVRVMD